MLTVRPAPTAGICNLILPLALVCVAGAGHATANETTDTAKAELITGHEDGWPQFRGPRRDGISDERGLLQSWPDGGPKELWRVEGLGRGYSSPIISNDRMFVTGDFDSTVQVLALDLEGNLLWRATNGVAWFNPYPGARSSVTYDDGHVYHLNARGDLTRFAAADGERDWSVNVLSEFDGENITWGLSECPLVDEQHVYVTAGGKDATVVALDKSNGEIVWRAGPWFDEREPGKADDAGYVSPILINYAGRRLLIGCSARNLYCLDADTGELQWTRSRPTRYSVLAMMPALIDDAVFMTAPHGTPGRLYRLIPPDEAGGTVGVREEWTTELDTCQGGAIYADGRIYGSYYPGRKGWAALDAESGETIYETTEYTKGAILHADNRLHVLCEDGEMVLLKAGETAFETTGRFQFVDARDRDAWAHPVVLDGRLYLRFHGELRCYDIRVRDDGE